MIFGLPVNSCPPAVTVHNTEIEQISNYKYLGICVDATLSWSAHTDYICSKVQHRICFLRRFWSFGAKKQILLLFFQSIRQSVMQYGVRAGCGCLSVQRKAQLTVGQTLEPDFPAAHRRRTLSLARNVTSDRSHILFEEYQRLPSNRRFRVPQARLNRLRLLSLSLLNDYISIWAVSRLWGPRMDWARRVEGDALQPLCDVWCCGICWAWRFLLCMFVVYIKLWTPQDARQISESVTVKWNLLSSLFLTALLTLADAVSLLWMYVWVLHTVPSLSELHTSEQFTNFSQTCRVCSHFTQRLKTHFFYMMRSKYLLFLLCVLFVLQIAVFVHTTRFVSCSFCLHSMLWRTL